MEAICDDIKKGITALPFRGKLEVIPDRRMAIKAAMEAARWNDIVLFIGKGTEQTIAIGDEKLPWNEEEIVIQELRNMLYDRT